MPDLRWNSAGLCRKCHPQIYQDRTPLVSTPIPQPGAALKAAKVSSRAVTVKILSTVSLNLIVYFLIGLPLAVFPSFVHFSLGYSAALAGFLISLQYAATLITRSLVGRLSDARGPKSAVLGGLACAAVSGVCILAASRGGSPILVLLWLSLSRLWLGAAESGVGTGCITWGIGRTGAAHTAEVMSWNGVVSYGGIALGAPVGVVLNHLGGIAALGMTSFGLALFGLVLCAFKQGTPVVPGVRMGLTRVFKQMLPYGATLSLASVGFGTIVAFITLYYASHGWHNAAYALSAFGVAFVSIRIFFSGAIRRFGGFRASAVSLAVECVGLTILWLAPNTWVAMLGAMLTGFGLSLVFPAMAVEALRTVSVANRGAAIGAYTVFLDVSLGVTGPLAGLIIGRFGYPAVYLLGAVSVALAEILTLWLFAKSKRSRVEVEAEPAPAQARKEAVLF
jgi:predicted MFS family arabinose efflux permease